MEDRIRDNFKGRRAGAFMHDEFEDDQEEMMATKTWKDMEGLECCLMKTRLWRIIWTKWRMGLRRQGTTILRRRATT
jgi:hypothetical protein